MKENTSNSKKIYSNTHIQNLVTIGLFLLHRDNYEKGFGKILIFASTYLCRADTGNKHYGTRINNNIMSFKLYKNSNIIIGRMLR